MADRVHPDIRRALGAAEAHASNADRMLAEAEAKKVPAPAKRSISPSSGFAMLEEEITETKHQIQDLAREIRQKQPSSPEVHVYLDRDSRPPESDKAGFSMRAPFGWGISAKGRVAWLVAIIVAVLVGGILLGRVTVPKGATQDTASRPK